MAKDKVIFAIMYFAKCYQSARWIIHSSSVPLPFVLSYSVFFIVQHPLLYWSSSALCAFMSSVLYCTTPTVVLVISGLLYFHVQCTLLHYIHCCVGHLWPLVLSCQVYFCTTPTVVWFSPASCTTFSGIIVPHPPLCWLSLASSPTSSTTVSNNI